MMAHTFTLIPFPGVEIPNITVSGTVSRRDNRLAILYSVLGDSNSIRIPPATRQPSRKTELWKQTCFEFFLALPGQPPYWEFNLSPSGDWNVYRIDAYRRIGFREEARIHELPFSVQKKADGVAVEASLDLSPIIKEEHPVQAGITSIIQTCAGQETYWALVHPKPEADFHVRESFILTL